MPKFPVTSRPAFCPSGRQRFVRHRSSGLSLHRAVRLAVDVFFRFDSRAVQSKSLWSATERVWMGHTTFLDWAIRDGGINIPWVVATANDAPKAPEQLREAILAELMSYWRARLGSLPRRALPHWLPLP
jgi:hypothetical protein